MRRTSSSSFVCAGLCLLLLPAHAQVLSAQAAERPAAEGPPVVFAALLTEVTAFGIGYAATLGSSGNEVVGAGLGLSSVAVLALARGWPEFLIPYGAGLMALAYYDLRRGDADSDARLMWTNALGFNAVVIASVISSLALSGDGEDGGSASRFTVGPSRSGVALGYRIPW